MWSHRVLFCHSKLSLTFRIAELKSRTRCDHLSRFAAMRNAQGCGITLGTPSALPLGMTDADNARRIESLANRTEDVMSKLADAARQVEEAAEWLNDDGLDVEDIESLTVMLNDAKANYTAVKTATFTQLHLIAVSL